MIIRPLEDKDIDQVYKVECDNFAQPWTKTALLGEIASEKSYYLVAVEGEEVLGYIGFWKIFDEGHITNIATKRCYHRRGIGSKLVEEMLLVGNRVDVDKFTLEVRVSNSNAIGLYEKYGFKPVGIRKGFYDLPKEDAVIMWRV